MAYTGKNALRYLEEEFKKKAQEAAKKAKAEEAKQKSTNVSTGGTTSHKGGKAVKASQSKGSHQTSNPTKTTKKPSYEDVEAPQKTKYKHTSEELSKTRDRLKNTPLSSSNKAGVDQPDPWDAIDSPSSKAGRGNYRADKYSPLKNKSKADTDEANNSLAYNRSSLSDKDKRDIKEANERVNARRYRLERGSFKDRASNVTHGSAESFAGAQLSSVGTAMQKWKTDEDSILKGEYIGGEKGQKKYSTRRGDRLTESQAKRKAEDTSESNGSRRQGVRVGDFERVYESDPNSFSSGLIKAGDTLQTAGSNRIERAKEGLGTAGKLAVDLSSNALMMAGDGLLNIIAPGAGLASLANRSGGMASYEMRQEGFNPDEQYRYALATSAVEVLSEQIGNGVSAFRGIYGKGAIDIADSVATRLGASRIVQDLFKHSKIGRNLVTELARLGVNMTEEGLEEVVADLAEPAMKYLITKDSGGQYDPATLKEMGYDYLIGSLMALAGGGGVDVARNLAMDTSASPAMVDGALSAASRSVMNIGLAQNEGTTANYLANAAQEQINKGGIVTEAQIRHIIDSASKERVSNEESRIEREDELVAEGIRKGEIETSKYKNTLAEDVEKRGYSEAYVKSIEKAYDQVVEAMGDVDLNDPITSEIADSLTREMVGSANTADIDTILSNSEAKAAYEKLTGETLPLSNTKAREVLETKSSINAIANNNQNYQMTWSKNAKEIAIAQNSNHGKNGQQVFLENYTKGEEVVGKAAYDDLFNKIYTAGTISDISLNEVVDMVNQTVEGSQAGKEYFTEARINQIFSAGRADTPTVRTVDSVLKKTANKGEKPTKRTGKLTIDESAMDKVTDSQKKALERLAKNGGVEIRIVDHIKNDSNNPEAIINGKYQGGVIYIAADSENPLITVAKHELTHWIKENNPEGYQKLENFVFKKWYHGNQNEMQAAIREYSNLYKGLTIQEVKEEIIADSTEAFFTDDEAVREVIEYDRSLGKTIRNGLRQILKDLAELRQSQTDGLENGYGDFLKDLNILTEAESLWAEAFGEAAKGTPTKGTVEFSTEAKQQLEELGASVTEGGTVAKNSLTSWKATDIAKLRKMLIEAGYSAKEVNKWIRDVNSVAAVIAADRGRLDYEADAYQDALKPNQEYFYTLDLSTLCAKRRLYQGTYNAIMKRLPNRAMMPEDTIRLRKMMADLKKEVPCGICYEESRKKNEGKFAETWLNGQTDKEWNQKLKEYEKKLKKYEQKLAEYNALENKGKKKPPKPPEKPERWMGYANMEHEDSFIPTLADVTTTTGRKKLRDEGHSEALESYLEYQKGRGSANPKVSFTHTDYRGDILRMTEKDIENVKHIGGLRIQSFSDFETIHVIDMMQAVMDMASKKLTAQAYTKVPAFADIFGGTGIKINLSLIGKVVNGKLTFDSKEGIDPKEAFRLRKKYSNNVGTILVGANVESILAAWADPRIDMVIPFHRSGWSTEEFEQLGLGDYEDFQDYQAERYLDGSPNGKSLADAKMQEIYSEDYWDPDKTGKENAEAYLKLCAEKHYRPVFYNFLHDNGDGTWSLQEDGSTDGYWKSLIDYKMYNNDGVGVRQEVAKPIFNMRAANKAMAEFDGDPNTLPIAEDVVDAFVKDYENRHKGTKFSMSKKEDQDYLDAVNRGDMETAQRMVDEYAKKHGYDSPKLYHGTPHFGFTQFKDNAHKVPFIYTSTNRTVSAHYAGDNNYAFPRPIGKAYKQGTSIADIIDNAKTIYDTEYKVMSQSQKRSRYNDVRNQAIKVADKLDDFYVKGSWDYETDNAIARVADLFFTIRDGEGEYDFSNYAQNDSLKNRLKNMVNAYKDGREIVKQYYDENRGNLSSGEKKYLSYLLGYDLGDVAIDIEYGMLRLMSNEDLLISNLGNVSVPSELKDAMDQIHEIGAYELFGNVGDNPFEFDANGGQFWALKVPQVGDGYYDTDSVSKWALENGYTSVIMHNIYDYGDKADNYVFFNSSQLKSADPVTYDDNGNVIPLSERFNKKNEDIRYSLTTKDKYENDEKLTRKQFNSWYFAHKINTRRGNLAEQIASIKSRGFKGGSGGINVMPADINDFGNIDVATQKYGVRKGETVLLVPKTFVKSDKVVEGFKPKDYEIVKAESDFQSYYELYEKAYNKAHEDARYSKKDSDGNKLSKGQQEFFKDSKLRDENGNLLVMYHGTEGANFTVFNADNSRDGISLFFTDSLNVAKGYSGTKRTYAPSKKSRPTINKLQKILDNEGDAYNTIRLEKVGDHYEANYYETDWVQDKEGEWQTKLVRNTSKSYLELKANSLEEMSRLIDEEFGEGDKSANYKVYLNLTNPLIIDADGKYWDELGELNDGLENTRAYAEYAKKNGYDGVWFKNIIDTALYASGKERFESSNVAVAFNSNQVKSVANTNPTSNADIRYSLSEKRNLQEENEKLKEAVWKKNEEMAYEKMASEIDLEKERRRRREAVKEIRTNKNAAIEKIRQHHRDVEQAKRERRQESEERTKLLNIARRLDKVKTNTPTKQLINEFIGDLDLVAKKMTGKTLENLNDLSAWYDEQRELDPFFSDSVIEKKINRISKKQIANMDINDVRDLTDVLKSIESSIRNGNKFVESTNRSTVKEAGLETIKNINKAAGVKRNSALGKADTLFINGTLSPVRQMHRITGYVDNDPLYVATQELADGQRVMMDYEHKAWDLFKRFTDDKKFVESLNGKKARPILLAAVKDGKTVQVKVTPDIAISLYLSCKNQDNMNHIGNGGVNIPDFDLYRKGNLNEAYENSARYTFSKEMLDAIEGRLTVKEREFADAAYNYYNEVAPEAINRVSNILLGYDLATVNNYFPIMTDKNFLNKDFESLKFDGTIEGQGSLKERVHADNPIEINGIVNTLTKSIKENSMYVGLAIPVRNMNKLLGVKDITWTEKDRGGRAEYHATYNGSVNESIMKKWGQPTMSYIENFMTDLQTSRKKRDDWVAVLQSARSNYAGAVLTFNASVAIKQAASYPTAGAVLGTMPLVRAMGNFGKVDLDLIAKYTPLQWYRSQGYSTTELGDIRAGRKGSLVDKATSKPILNWIQTMDILTTRKLWKASEYYVRQHSKSLKVGSDEYYKVVADIYNRVIEETQPNYATMQRPGLLRSDDSLVQTLNMFKTQPYQNFNILYDAIGNYTAKRNAYKEAKTEENKAAAQEAYAGMQRAVISQLAQLAVFASMGFAWAFFRGKADKWKYEEEDKITLSSFLKRLGYEMLSGSFAMIPFGQDIFNAFSKDYTYGFTSVTDSSINDLLNTGSDLVALFGSLAEYSDTENKENYDTDALFRQVEKVIKEWGRFTGVPVDNLWKTYDAIYRWTMIAANGKYVGEYLAAKETLQKDSVKKMLLYKAYRHDPEQYELLRERMIEDGFDEDDLTSGLNSWLVKNMSKEETERFNESMDKIKASTAWQEATDDEKKDYENKVRKYVLGISDSTTSSIEKYASENDTSFEDALVIKLSEKQQRAKEDAAKEEGLSKLSSFKEWNDLSEEQQNYYTELLAEVLTGSDTARADAIRGQAVDGKSVEDVLHEGMIRERQSLNTVSSSSLWESAGDGSKDYYDGVITKLSLGIEDKETGYVTQWAQEGLTNEQVILYKLALKKADADNNNNGSSNKAEREAALQMLLKEYDLTPEQIEVLSKMK